MDTPTSPEAGPTQFGFEATVDERNRKREEERMASSRHLVLLIEELTYIQDMVGATGVEGFRSPYNYPRLEEALSDLSVLAGQQINAESVLAAMAERSEQTGPTQVE